MTMKRTVAFAAVTVIAFLLLSDVALRLFLSPLPSRPFEWPPPDMTKHGMMEDKALFWKLRPGYNDRWGLYKLAYTHELVGKKQIDWKARKRLAAPVYKGVTWEVNQDGFRGPLIPKEKLPHTRRLLFLGSSITFGWGVPAAEVFPEIVRKGLQKAFPDISLETINAGVPGYSSFQGLLYLETILPRFRPDVVVAEFGINDGTVATGKQDKDWRPRFSDTVPQALRRSGWGRLVLRLFHPLIKKPGIVDKTQTWDQARKSFYRVSMTGALTRVAPDDFAANLDKMAALCRKNGALFYVFIPSLYNEYGDKRLTASVNFLTSYSIPIHKTLSSYPPEVLQILFLPFDEGHLSRAGHNVVGKCMVDFLTPRIATDSGQRK